jgi:hypothetical protein
LATVALRGMDTFFSGADERLNLFHSPGRFFAASEIKMLLAYVLLNYDVKLAGSRGHPADWWFGFHSMPDPTVEVMFRRRTCDVYSNA